LPQWNCGCVICAAARGGRIQPLTQFSVALRDDSGKWFLINASPDLPAQIRSHPYFQPNSGSPRNTPISGVLLTNADLDHVLGLLSLREGEKLHIHATKAVQDTLDECLNLTAIMEAFCGIVWHGAPEGDFMPLISADGSTSSLAYRAVILPGSPPLFARGIRPQGAYSVAFQILDRNTGGRLLVAPDVAECTEALIAAMRESDAVFFDGTFWSDHELLAIKANGRTAREMGHVTIKDFSLPLLKSLPARHKIYVHVNNTNPILIPDSPERGEVNAAGILVGFDGLEFDL